MIVVYYASAVLVVVFAVLAIHSKDLLYSVIYLAGSSLMLSLVYFTLRAPDIAITQAAVNAGLVTAIFIFTLNRTRREE